MQTELGRQNELERPLGEEVRWAQRGTQLTSHAVHPHQHADPHGEELGEGSSEAG